MIKLFAYRNQTPKDFLAALAVALVGVGFVTIAGLGLFAHRANAGASLAISSVTVASNGTTLTIPMSGVTGSLSPTSTITGFTVYVAVASSTDNIVTSSVTASGTTVTITLATPVQTGDVLTVTLASPTNLTDTGSDTPTVGGANTSHAVTNNSTQSGVTAGIANPKLYFEGPWGTSVNQGSGDSTASAQEGELDFQCANCTDMSVHGLGNQTYSISVDGGTASNFTPPSSPNWWQWFPGASGLSNGTHTFRVTGPYLETNNAIRVSSSAGASLNTILTYGTQWPLGGATFQSAGVLDGSPTEVGSGNTAQYQWSGTDSGIRFNSDCANISAWLGQIGTSFLVYRDGVQYGSVYTTNTTITYTYVPLVTGSDGAMHSWEIFGEDAAAVNSPAIYMNGIMGTGVSSQACTSGFGTQPAARPFVAFIGESLVAGNAYTSDLRNVDPWIAGHALGFSNERIAYSGERVDQYDTLNPLTNYTPRPSLVVLRGGGNDMLQNYSTSTFATNMQTWITDTAGTMSAGGKIIVEGNMPIPTGTVPASTRASYNTIEQAAVANYMGTSPSIPAYYVSTDNWIINTVASGDIGADAIHITPQGFLKVANREIPLFNGYITASGTAFSVTGPTTGTSTVPSSNFTVSLPGGATYTGDQTISISDGGNGGTFTPSVGSPSTSSITVTPTASTTSFTFTYTPASTGVKTLSFTNGQNAWVNPANATFTANSSAATSYTFTGPSSGNAGATSTNFTVTPNGTYNGTISIAPTGSGATGLSTTTLTFASTSTPQTFTITPTVAGTITLTPSNNGGLTDASSTTYTVSAVAPNSPTGVSATPGNAQATVNFSTPAFNGGSAILYYTASSSPSGITATSASTSIVVTGLTNGQSYTFTVTATNAAGTSTPSSASSAVTPATIPGPPTSPVATAGNATSTVTFVAPVSNGGSAITGYTVISYPAGGTDANAASTTLTHLITGLTNGTPYTFTVTATNAIGTSTPSSASNSVTPNAPAATSYTFTGPSSGNAGATSTNFTVTPNGVYSGTISIAPTGSGSAGLSTTTLTFASSSAAQTFTITPTVAGSITLTPTNNATLTNPSNLTYTVNAVAPGAPTSAVATAGNTSATVTFTAPSFNGGSSILYYTASSSPSGIKGTSSSTSILVSGLVNGTPYVFTVYATNSAGTSTPSSASNSVTPSPALTAITPTILPNATTSVAYSQVLTANGDSAPYTWSLLSGNLPAGLSLATSSTAATTTISGTPTVASTTNFTIEVQGASGATTTQAYSLTVIGTSTPPQTLAGIATSGQISLSWMAPTSTNGSNLTQYIVQDKLTASSTFVTTATTSTTTLTSIITGLTNSTSYDFQVLAQNGVGTSSPSSIVTIIPNIAAVISSTTASNISTSGATITWTTDRLSDSQVAYGTSSGNYTATTSVADVSPMVTSHAVNLSGLSSGTTYYYIAISTDNTVATSTEQTFTTTAASSGGGGGGSSGGGGGIINTFAISNITTSSSSTSVTVSWSTNISANSEVDYGLTTSYGQAITDPNYVTGHSLEITGLIPGQTYHFQIKGATNYGSTAVSGDYSFVAGSTAQAVPSAPTTSTTPGPSGSGLTIPGSSGPTVGLINYKGTFYLLEDGQRYGITNPGILNSYGLSFSDASLATEQDMALPQGPNLSPDNGALVKSLKDPTVYLISTNRRYGFTSAKVFTSLGFKFSSVLTITNPELQALPMGPIISNPASAHLPGTDVNDNGTVYWIGPDNLRHAYASLAAWNSFHLAGDFSTVVVANSADLLLGVGTIVESRMIQ